MMPIMISMKIRNFSEVTQFLSLSKVSLLKIFAKCSENVGFDENNNLQENLKIFKSDSFENYKSFVSSESDVHSLN